MPSLAALVVALLVVATAHAARDCARRCGDEIALVCATNGVTYANGCLFDVAQCANASLAIAAAGVCKATPPPPRLPAFFASEARCERACTREYMPVCGSDGVTYPNKCVFRNAQRCKYHGDLTVVKHGAC